MFTLDFGSKVGLIEGSWSTVSNGEIVTGPVVYGREGVITADRFDSKVKLYKDFVPYRPSPPPNEVFDTPMQESGAMAKELCAHFLDGAPLHELLTLAFNMKAQAALCAGIRSCESGRAEDVEDPFFL